MDTCKLTFVNVGYGEAMLLRCPDPAFPGGVFTMLVDGGSAEATEFADRSTGRGTLGEYLRRWGVDRVDCAVSTHIHEDHVCGLLPALDTLPPPTLWQTLPPEIYRELRPLDETLACNESQGKFLRALNDYRALCAMVTARGGAVRTLRAGESGTLCQGLSFRVLAPNAASAAELEARMLALYAQREPAAFLQELSQLDARMNNFSLMLRLEYRGVPILLPGDTNAQGYGGISPEYLRARVFKVGHHGQRDGATPALLSAIGPEVVVCCASSDRRYDSAHPAVLEMVERAGARTYFSDCPQQPGQPPLLPHRALEIAIGADGSLESRYLDA